MNKEELDKVLKDHSKWLKDSNKGKRANLRNANLSNADLSNANLSNANLRNADLRGTILPEGFYYTNLGKHTLYAYKGMIRIGCKYLSVEDWLKNGKAIAKENYYDKVDIKRYLDFIRQYKKECKNEK